MPKEQPMRKVVFAINITIDGYCGHEAMLPDDDVHEYFTGLCAIQALIFSGATRIT